MFKDDALQYTLKQPSLLKQAISSFLFLFYRNPFYFYKDGHCCGSWEPLTKTAFSLGKWEFNFEGSIYRVFLGPHGVNHTLSLNGIPVAKYATKRGDSGHYHVAYTDAIKHRPDILLLFAVFVEHYPERDSKV